MSVRSKEVPFEASKPVPGVHTAYVFLPLTDRNLHFKTGRKPSKDGWGDTKNDHPFSPQEQYGAELGSDNKVVPQSAVPATSVSTTESELTKDEVNLSDYPITLNADSLNQLMTMFHAAPARIEYVYTGGEPGSFALKEDGSMVVRFENDRDLNVYGLTAYGVANNMWETGSADVDAARADALYQVAQIGGWSSQQYVDLTSVYNAALRGVSDHFSSDRVVLGGPVVGFPFSCFPKDGSLVASDGVVQVAQP